MKPAKAVNPASECPWLEDKRSADFENCKIKRVTKVHIFLGNGKFFYPIIVEKLAPLGARGEPMFDRVACICC
jgi:hypothetical protein